LLGYAQYYLPDLAESTHKKPPKFKLDYVTHPVEVLRPPNTTEFLVGFMYMGQDVDEEGGLRTASS
jgi:hypothetical protein